MAERTSESAETDPDSSYLNELRELLSRQEDEKQALEDKHIGEHVTLAEHYREDESAQAYLEGYRSVQSSRAEVVDESPAALRKHLGADEWLGQGQASPL